MRVCLYLRGVAGVSYERGTPVRAVGFRSRLGGLWFAAISEMIRFLVTMSGMKSVTALEATQGQNGIFFSQLPYKCCLEVVASVEY